MTVEDKKEKIMVHYVSKNSHNVVAEDSSIINTQFMSQQEEDNLEDLNLDQRLAGIIVEIF